MVPPPPLSQLLDRELLDVGVAGADLDQAVAVGALKLKRGLDSH